MFTLLQINVTVNTGSTGKICEQIGLQTVHEGWKCYIAHGARYINMSELNTIPFSTIRYEYIHAIWYSMFLDKHGLGSLDATRNLINKIETKIKPDIIHLHNIHGYYLNYKLLFEYLSKKDIPVVWTLHDCWSFTGHCVHYSIAKCEKWQTECHNCPNLGKYPKSLFRDNSKNNFRLKKSLFTSVKDLTLVPVSKWLAGECKKSFFKDTKIYPIYNGLDLNVFTPQNKNIFRCNYKLKDKTVLLGVAAPWTVQKGFKDFFKLRKLLSSQYVIVLVGLSAKQISKLPPGIIGIQRTQNVLELAEIYSESDIFINLSYEETFGMTTAEAMACGTPVIVYNSTACPEIVTNETGKVVEPGNIEQLVDAIHFLELIDRNKIAKLCRNYAELHFDKQRCFQQYINLYNNILKNHVSI